MMLQNNAVIKTINQPSFTFGLIGLVVGAGLIYGATQKYSLIQKMRNTPRSKIRSAAVGLVELDGTSKGEPLTSPIAGKPCVYWHVEIDSVEGKRNLARIGAYKSGRAFFLEDETGRIMIEADLQGDGLKQTYWDTAYLKPVNPEKPHSQKVLDFIRSQRGGGDFLETYKDKKVVVCEYVVEAGQPLYVLGNAEILEETGGSLAVTNLIIKSKGESLHVSRKPESGATMGLWITFFAFLIIGLLAAGGGLYFLLSNLF
jgi:hypothetical protein